MESLLKQQVFDLVSEFMRVVSYETERYGSVPMLAYQFPLVANYRCSMIARSLADFINMDDDSDLQARTITVEGIDPNYNHGYAHPSDRGEFFWHEVTLVNEEIVIDLSFRQLDITSEFPYWSTLDRIKTIWNAVDTEPDIYSPKTWTPKFLSVQQTNAYIEQSYELSQSVKVNGLVHHGYEAWHNKPLPAGMTLTLLNSDGTIVYV